MPLATLIAVRRSTIASNAFAAAMTLAAGVMLLSPGPARAQCTGCTTTYVGNNVVHRFNASGGTFTPPAGVVSVTYLVVGGGGGGGGITTAANVGGGGGGGAGGFRAAAGFAVTPLTVYPITVGGGGTAGVGGTSPGGTGGISIFSTITANGGGGGASVGANNGVAGASGGGGRGAGTGGAGTGGQGNNGGAGNAAGGAGGGGGATAVGTASGGTTGGAGGAGTSNSITGAAVNYAGGGGGGGYTGASGAGGAGGGGAGGAAARTVGTNGAANTGGGGGGARGNNTGTTARNGGSGGSGVVFVSYAMATRYGVATGNWNATTTWSAFDCAGATGAPVPTSAAGNIVTICNTRNVTVNAASNAASVTVQSGAALTQISGLTITGALDITGPSGVVTSTNALSVGTATTVGGTLNLGGAGGKAFGGDVTVSGTWNETAAVAVGVAGNLTNNAATWSASATGAYTFSGAGMTISGSTATVIPNTTISGTYTNVNTLTVNAALAGGGTLTNGDGVTAAVLNIGGTSTITGLTANPANNTVNYTGAAAAQTVKATTYNILNLSGGAAGPKTAATPGVAVNSTLTISAATLFTVPAFTLNVTGLTTVGGTLSLTSATGAKNLGPVTVQNLGILDLQASSPTFSSTVTVQSGGIMQFATAAGGTKTFNGTVTIDAGGQLQASQATTVNFNADVTNNGTWNETAAVVMGFAGNLLNNGTAWTSSTGVHTFSGAGRTISGSLLTSIPSLTVTGTYTNVNALTVGTALAGAGTLTNGNGVIAAVLNIGGTSTITGLTANPANNTVNYTGAAQTVKQPTPAGIPLTPTYNNLTLSGSGAVTMPASALAITGNFTTSGTQSSTAGGAMTIGGNVVLGGGTTFNASTFSHSLLGGFTNNGATFTAATSTITMGGTAGQAIGGTATTTFNNLTISNTSAAVTLTAATNSMVVGGTLTVNASAVLTPNAALIVSGGGTLTGPVAGFGRVQVTRTAATADFSSQYTITNKTLDFLTVEYVGAAQTVSAINYTGNLTINNASGPTLAAGTTTVGKTLTLTSGTLSVAARTLELNGPTIAGTPTNLSTTSSSNLTFGGGVTGSAGVNVPSSVLQLANLTVNNTNGITLNSSPTINGALTFTLGNISAGSNTVIIPAAGSVSRTSGHVIGNLQKNVAVSAGSIARSFEIGDANAYSPIAITFSSVGTAGDLVARTTSLEHPDVANSLIDSSQNVNRYWTLTNSGIAFSDYSAATTYASGSPVDLDAGVDATVAQTFGIGKADSCDGAVQNCTWTYPAMVGTPTTTSAQASGMTSLSLTSLSYFVVGRKLATFVVQAAGGGAIPTQNQGAPFNVSVTAVDSAGGTITSFTGTVTISSAAGCGFSAGSGPTLSFVNGVLTSHSVTISSAASCNVTATGTGSASGVSANSNSFLVRAAVTSFDACEVVSPQCTAGAVDFDRLFTKLANTAFNLDLVAIQSGGTLNTDFAGTATVALLANTTAQIVGANSCPAGATATIPLGNLSFTAGRQTAAVAANALSSVAPNYSAYRDVRVRVACDSTNCPPSGLTWCSADNFSVRPLDFTISAPVLTNVAQIGTPSAAAGSDFTLTAAAIAGYNGTPSLDRTLAGQKVVTHSSVTDYTARLRDSTGGNTITFPAATIGTGVSTNTVQYHDAGNVGILANGIVDSSFTTVDDPVKDCVGGSSLNTDNDGNANNGLKYGCNIANQSNSSLFGRFFPSSYVLSSPSVTAACAAGGFSYMGHAAMGLVFTISAMSQDNPIGATLKLAKYTALYGTLATVGVLAEDGITATDLSANFSPTLAYSAGNWNAGDYAVTGSSYAFARPASTPSGPYDSLYFAAGVTDADGAALPGLDFKLGDPTCTVACTHKKLSATATKIRFGRMRLLGAVGSETLNLPIPIRTEYWTGTGFATNTLDTTTALDNCTTLAPAAPKKFVLFGHQSGITTSNMITPTAGTDGNVSTTGTFVNGAGSLTLLKPAPAPTTPGSVRICLDLDVAAAVGDLSCQAVSPANLTHLQGKWSGSNYDKDPSARAAFGLYGSQPRQFIFFRENY